MPRKPAKPKTAPAPTAPAPEQPLPEVVSLATLAELSGYGERRLQQLAQEGAIPKPERPGEYPLRKSLAGLFHHLREMANGLPAQTAGDKARQARADADRSEISTGKELELLMFREDAKLLWADALVKVREAILRAPISAKAKAEISTKLQKIKLTE